MPLLTQRAALLLGQAVGVAAGYAQYEFESGQFRRLEPLLDFRTGTTEILRVPLARAARGERRRRPGVQWPLMRSRVPRWIWILAVIAGAYAVLGYFVLPPVLRPRLEERLSAELGRRVSIGAIRIHPFALSVAFERVQVLTAGGGAPFAGWRRLYVNFDLLRLVRGRWVIGEIALEELRGVVEIDEHGVPSIADLLDKLAEWRESGSDYGIPARPWSVSRLYVADARMDFVDRSRGEIFRTQVGPVDFTVLGLRTTGGRGAQYRFEARAESGEKLAWAGSLSARPFASAGEWRIENLGLSKYAAYFIDGIDVSLTSGMLTIGGRYDVSLAPGDRRMMLTEGAAQLTKLTLVESATGLPLLDAANVEVTGLSVDGLAPRVSAGAVQMSGGWMAARRDGDGVLNFAALLKARSAVRAQAQPSAADPPAVDAKRFEFAAGEIALRDFTILWQDLAAPRLVRIELTGFDATLKNFTLAPDATVPVEVAFGMTPQGTARVTGSIGFQPFRMDLGLELAWIALPPLSPYLERVAPVRLSKGVASLKGGITYVETGDAPVAAFTGSGRVEQLVLLGAADGGELAGCSNLAVNDATMTSAPEWSVLLGTVALSAPYVHAVVDENGKLNFSELAHPSPTAPTGVVAMGGGTDAVAPPAPPLDIAIARLAIDGGEVTFVDRSVRPQVQMAVKRIGGTLLDVSSRMPESGRADFSALVEGESPLTAKGRLNPFAAAPLVDLVVEGKSIDLLPTNPYLAKYAGHEIERGELFVTAKARLAGEKFDLQSTVTLDQFTLGRATPSPDAVNLPVRLGVALLKDANGKIVFDLPVQGSLADPQFSARRIVGQVFTNVLVKAAASPFALLGSMFGGGGEELGYQEFFPGVTIPTPESATRLATLQRAMVERPGLNLEIEPGYNPGELDELKRAKFDEAVRQRVWEKLHAADATLPPVDQLLVSRRDRADAIEAMFDEKFGGRRTGTPAPRPPIARPQPVAVAPSAAPVERVAREEEEERPGLFRRAWNFATLKGLRERALRSDEPAAPPPPPAALAQSVPPAQIEAAEPPPAQPAPSPGEISKPSPGEMEQRLVAAMPVGPDDLARLAEARAQRVKEILTEGDKISPERVQIAKLDPDAGANGPVVMLHLR